MNTLNHDAQPAEKFQGSLNNTVVQRDISDLKKFEEKRKKFTI